MQFGIIPGKHPRDVFEYEASNGRLAVRGSSGVALCSGFYQYVRTNHLGIASWSGNRLDISNSWPDAPLTRVESPYRYRYYFNAVTFGYSTPYWNWDRWQHEIDWMVLHGINMPLSLTATEAIGQRVWKRLGLSQKEIDDFYTGPAYLPFNRMGNVAKLDGSLTANWDREQIALEHRVLRQERALGMFPIAQGFAGFVPLGLKRVHPEVNLTAMKWGEFGTPALFPEEYQSHLLSPDSPLFAKIGELTIKEWEAEFGKDQFFLADTFNEMRISASSEAAKDALLARYGGAIYSAIRDGDPNATWVMQSWMFGYMRNFWTKQSEGQHALS